MSDSLPSATADWVTRCRSRFLQLDPLLPLADLAPIVADMSARARWRAMSPEAAAERVFVPHPTRHASLASAATATA